MSETNVEDILSIEKFYPITTLLDKYYNCDQDKFYTFVSSWNKKFETDGHFYLPKGQYYKWLEYITIKCILFYNERKIYDGIWDRKTREYLKNPDGSYVLRGTPIISALNLKRILMAIEEHSITGIFKLNKTSFIYTLLEEQGKIDELTT